MACSTPSLHARYPGSECSWEKMRRLHENALDQLSTQSAHLLLLPPCLAAENPSEVRQPQLWCQLPLRWVPELWAPQCDFRELYSVCPGSTLPALHEELKLQPSLENQNDLDGPRPPQRPQHPLQSETRPPYDYMINQEEVF